MWETRGAIVDPIHGFSRTCEPERMTAWTSAGPSAAV